MTFSLLHSMIFSLLDSMTFSQTAYSKARRSAAKAAGMCQKCYGQPAIIGRVNCQLCQMRVIIRESFKYDRRRKMPGSTAARGSCYVDQFSASVRKTWTEQILQKWTGRCYYTGLLIEVGSTAGLDHKLPVSRAASFGPTKVFHPDNLVWVHKSVNILKGDMTADEFAVWLRQDLPAALATATVAA
jgi:hypothetical protein